MEADEAILNVDALDVLLDLHRKASLGPVQVVQAFCPIDGGSDYALCRDRVVLIECFGIIGSTRKQQPSMERAQFIAETNKLVPAMVAEIRRLRQDNAKLLAELNE